MRRAALPALILLFAAATATAQSRPKGQNCNLAAPPASAGEEHNHGITLRVFPRAREINASYSGCQALFAPDGKKWALVSLTEVSKGDPIRVWSEHEREPERLRCRYKNRELVAGNPDLCPAPEFILVKSMPPGCVQVVREAVAKGGLGVSRPKECEYD